MFKNRKNLVSINSLGGKIQLSEWKKSRSRPEVFCQKGFLKISQNSQESTCTGVFFIGVTDLSLFCKTKVNGCFLKPRLLLNWIEQFPEFQSDDVFLVNFAKILRTIFFTERLRWLPLFYGNGVCFPCGGFPVS